MNPVLDPTHMLIPVHDYPLTPPTCPLLPLQLPEASKHAEVIYPKFNAVNLRLSSSPSQHSPQISPALKQNPISSQSPIFQSIIRVKLDVRAQFHSFLDTRNIGFIPFVIPFLKNKK